MYPILDIPDHQAVGGLDLTGDGGRSDPWGWDDSVAET